MVQATGAASACHACAALTGLTDTVKWHAVLARALNAGRVAAFRARSARPAISYAALRLARVATLEAVATWVVAITLMSVARVPQA